MSIPASLTSITVTARYYKPDGSPAAGSVRFQLSAAATAPADRAIVPLTSVKALLDTAGAISVVLAASDDPDWSASGLTYQVTERIVGAEPRTYNVAVPAAAAGGTVDLAALAPAVAGPALVSYVLAAAVGAPSGVASLDATGQVPLSQLGNAPAGGGGGAVASVNDQTGVVVLDAADVGADPAGTATTQVTAHTLAFDPHGDRAYAAGQVTAHTGAVDPHGDRAHTDAGLAAKASKLIVRRGYVTSGNIVPQATPAAWQPLTGGPTFAIPASIGDYVDLAVAGMWAPPGAFWDLAVLVGGNLVRFASTGGAVPAVEGDPALYAQPGSFRTFGWHFDFEGGAGDLDGGNVNIVWAVKGPGSGTLFASESYPLRWRLINHGAVSLS